MCVNWRDLNWQNCGCVMIQLNFHTCRQVLLNVKQRRKRVARFRSYTKIKTQEYNAKQSWKSGAARPPTKHAGKRCAWNYTAKFSSLRIWTRQDVCMYTTTNTLASYIGFGCLCSKLYFKKCPGSRSHASFWHDTGCSMCLSTLFPRILRPCLLDSKILRPKTSHWIFGHIHEVLNKIYLQNFLYGWVVNREMNLMSLLKPWFITNMLQ